MLCKQTIGSQQNNTVEHPYTAASLQYHNTCRHDIPAEVTRRDSKWWPTIEFVMIGTAAQHAK